MDDFKKEVLLQDTQSYRIFAAVLKRIIMELPEDPMMLFSVINMKLRDCYASLDELCEDMNISKGHTDRKTGIDRVRIQCRTK